MRVLLCALAIGGVALAAGLAPAGVMGVGSDAAYRKTSGGVVDPDLSDPKSTSGSPFALSSGVTTSEGSTLDFSGDAFARSEIFGGGITTSSGVSSAVSAEGVFVSGAFNELIAQTTYSEVLPSLLSPSQYEFFVTGPVLEVFDSSNASLDQQPYVSYEIQILRNGAVQFGSSATLRGDLNDIQLTKDGTDLGGTPTKVDTLVWRSEFRGIVGSFAVQGGDQIDYLLRATVSTLGREAGGTAAIGDPGSVEGFSGGLVDGTSVVPEPSAFAVWAAFGLLTVPLKRQRSRGGNGSAARA